jgi:hypothetical protein
MKCPNCGKKLTTDKATAHHGDNAFVKCQDDCCVYGQHWQKLKDIRAVESDRAMAGVIL